MWDRQGEPPPLPDGPRPMLPTMRYHLEPQGHQVRGGTPQNDSGEIHHPLRLLGIRQSVWLDSSVQRRKVIDRAIEVASYLRKNEDLRIDQALKVVSMCLPSLFSFSVLLIRWPEADFKTVTAIWLRAYKNAWNIDRSTAACLLTFPRENGGLQVKLPLVTLSDSMWGNLERCHQFDNGTRPMMKLAYLDAPTGNACSHSWKSRK